MVKTVAVLPLISSRNQALIATDPAAFLARFGAAADREGFRTDNFGEVSGYSLRAFTKRTPGPRPRIYLSAGIHGDEPASSLALLDLLEAGTFDRRAIWFLCPLLNPAGLVHGVRENPEGIDLNRDYRQPQSAEARSHIAWLQRQPNFDLSLCLHEDWESTGFYLYELAVQPRPGLAEAVLESVRPSLAIEPSSLIDGREAHQGIIRPSPDPALREKWPESLYIHERHHTALHYTFESPSRCPLSIRIAALRAAVELVLGRMT